MDKSGEGRGEEQRRKRNGMGMRRGRGILEEGREEKERKIEEENRRV